MLWDSIAFLQAAVNEAEYHYVWASINKRFGASGFGLRALLQKCRVLGPRNPIWDPVRFLAIKELNKLNVPDRGRISQTMGRRGDVVLNIICLT